MPKKSKKRPEILDCEQRSALYALDISKKLGQVDNLKLRRELELAHMRTCDPRIGNKPKKKKNK